MSQAWNTIRSSPFAPAVLTALLAVAVHSLIPGARPADDSLTYSGIASGLTGYTNPLVPYANASWAIHGLAVRGYLYPLFVGIVYMLTGGVRPGAAEWAQAVVFLPLTTLLLYAAGREAFSRRVGLVAAWLFALWLPTVWQTMWLLTETVLAFLMALMLACLAGALRRSDWRLASLTGVTAALISVSHSAYQLTWLVVGLALTVHLWRRDERTRLVFSYALASGAILMAYVVFTRSRQTCRTSDRARRATPEEGAGRSGQRAVGRRDSGPLPTTTKWPTSYQAIL